MTDKGALGPAQMSKKYLEGARALVIVVENPDSVTGNGDVGLDGVFNGTVGPVHRALAGRDFSCLHSSAVSLLPWGSGIGLQTPAAVSGAGSCP